MLSFRDQGDSYQSHTLSYQVQLSSVDTMILVTERGFDYTSVVIEVIAGIAQEHWFSTDKKL